MRSEGYDSNEVDSYVDELRSEIVEVRRALETATPSGDAPADSRLHDPEGAVTRTLAIAQETADRVLHDSQVEADRRRAEADEHATSVIAEADERAARLLGEMEAQAAEVREQGVAAARSAIQVERDKAMAELAHVRRVRDDLRSEAVALKTSLDAYRSQAREASDTLAAASSGPLMSLDLPDFIDDEVLLAGISPVDGADTADFDTADFDTADDGALAASDGSSHLRAVDSDLSEDTNGSFVDSAEDGLSSDDSDSLDNYSSDDEDLAPVIALDGDDDDDDDDSDASSDTDGLGGTFLAEVRAAAQDDVSLPPEDSASTMDFSASSGDADSDRFLSELRGINTDDDDELDSEAAETFFDSQD